MNVIYVYSKCSTCKNALRFLKEKKISVDIREITLTPPTFDELKLMLKYQKGQLKKLFNTSGNLYREMQLADNLDKMPESQALELLTKNGMLVKRPFLLSATFGLLGYNESEWAQKL